MSQAAEDCWWCGGVNCGHLNPPPTAAEPDTVAEEQIAELRKDAERLDWLGDFGVDIADSADGEIKLRYLDGDGYFCTTTAPSLREAIDSARHLNPNDT